MFFATRPDRDTIARVLARSRILPLSYDPVGIAKSSPAGYAVDEYSAVIGRGAAAFERAKHGLAAWRHFQVGWVEVYPPRAPIDAGTVVVILVHHLGFWSLNGCRVVYGIGDREQGSTFGFAYGTLDNHAERGEEIFEVGFQPESADVVYRIRAVSQPRATLARIGIACARLLQARFRRDSAEAIRRSIGSR